MNPTTAAFRVDGKVCLITGGASGLGLAGARALLDAGAVGVTLVDMNPTTLASASASLQSADKVSTFAGDVSKEEVNKGMVEHVKERWGKAPEVVVLCAGISQAYQVPLAEMPEEVWDKVMAVNLKGSKFHLVAFVRCVCRFWLAMGMRWDCATNVFLFALNQASSASSMLLQRC